MNRAISFVMVLLTSTILAFAVRAQTPAASAPKTTLQLLETMKVDNAAVIQRQAALLLKLDELQKEASQIKFLAKRG